MKEDLERYLEREGKKEFYPSKFARGSFTVHNVVELVEERDDIERVYKVLCPKCKTELGSSSRLANLIAKEVSCDDCDIMFSPDYTQVVLAYKQG